MNFESKINLLTARKYRNTKTPKQTHPFTPCEFTLITPAASAVGREETVQGI